MTTFTYSFKNSLALLLLVGVTSITQAQTDTSTTIKRNPSDSASSKLNMDAVYNRPFLTAGKLPIAIGGYLEANTQYAQTNGINEGFSFQMRRMTLFFSSTIAKKIKFISEIEFEDGTKEINLETALMDIEFHPLVNLRGGVIMNPIGAFNQNHDGPRWDFIDRPIASTTILAATLSNVGFGLHGKYFTRGWVLGYEAYLTNGFDDKVISNELNRTSLAAGKSNAEKFEESNSGLPMFTGKVAIRNRKIGEIGLSYMSGVYNKFQKDGLTIDNKRTATAMAFDFNTSLLKNKLNITGEVVKVMVDVPETYSQTFGTEQFGGFVDIVGTLLQRQMFGWDKAKLNLGVRLEYADYNQGKFRETNGNIADDIWAIVPTIAFRPVGTTVLRFNYRYQEQTDFLGNLPARTGIIQFGFSTYF
ncbi:MAG: hypothetical protein V4538_13300 [Bacteroidota bacterium]